MTYILRTAARLAALGLAASVATPSPLMAQQMVDGYTLAFRDADVRRVADAVLGSMLGVEYRVDPAVTGSITLSTSSPVPRARLLELFEEALASVDAVLIVDGDRYLVTPRSNARGGRGLTDNGRSSSGYASEEVQLHAGSAIQISRLIGELLGQEVVSNVDPITNRLIITGTARERSAARDIINRFDVDALANMTFEMVKLEMVDAETLESELSRIFQPPYDYIGTRVRVIPIARLRSVLLISTSRSDLATVREWVARLDTGVAGKRRLYGYAVQNGRARDLAQTLQAVLSSTMTAPPAEVAPSAPPSIQLADNPGDELPVPSGEGIAEPAVDKGPRVVPNEASNSLLIFADGEEYEFILEALTYLDQPVPQVLVEAILAEVTLTDDLQYGLNFDALSGNFSFTNSNTGSGTPASQFPGFSAAWVGSSASAILNAIQSKTNVRVLSAPKLIVLNNQTATLQVGDQVPVITSQVQGVLAPGAPIVNNVELKDTGVILQVTPRVNESGAVTFDITQEVSDVAPTTTSGINSPTIQQRKVTTTVSTRSGQMIALGGLIRDRDTETKSGIPVLSQIPLIGGLFGQRIKTGTRTELIMLLTPTVIRSAEDVDATVGDLLDAMDRAGPLVLDAGRTMDADAANE